MSFLTSLEWRYATKLFDTNKKVSDEHLEKIIEAIRLTPTSFGLQPYHFYIVSNQEIKDKIQAVAWNQTQIGTASHVIVFAARTDLMKNKDEYFSLISGGSDEVRSTLKGYEDMVTGFINSKDETSALTWTSKQVYIAHGFALAAAAELQIDSCPMEGFDPVAVGEILGVPENEKVLVILPIGYRASTDGPRTPHKMRFSKESLFTEVK
ncbi:NAD(P)H-dependent oxidoreductase [Candidatus Gracilibacteria bacterium]|nr:NAD(P)H-dependent oxidoreductase [Candidatus Gracilibacteria bacterium]